MKKLVILFSAILLLGCKSENQTLKVLQFNIWHEGRQVENGFEGIVQQIIGSEADVVTFSEVNNAEGVDFSDAIVKALAAKGHTFYSFYSEDTGILSKYPIKEHKEIFNAGNNINKVILEIKGKELAIYSAHLDYLHCSYYLAKGYDGTEWHKIDAPITDVDSILRDNLMSTRDEAITAFLAESKSDLSANRTVILAGDFNEPSHLDWSEATKNLYDHNGLIIPWSQSVSLTNAGFVDTYREKYPSPVSHPGFTYPAFTPGVDFSKLVWAPEMDERERIDFIYYLPANNIKLKDVVIWGPDESVCKSKKVKESTSDIFKSSVGVWPSDHKAVLATFLIK